MFYEQMGRMVIIGQRSSKSTFGAKKVYSVSESSLRVNTGEPVAQFKVSKKRTIKDITNLLLLVTSILKLHPLKISLEF